LKFQTLITLTLIFITFSCTDKVKEKNLLITADGSSTVFPITEAIAEEYMKKNHGSKITIGISGTGGGFKKFCKGQTLINNASRSIKEIEQKLCKSNNIKYIKIPVAYDGITVVINPKNTWATKLTTTQLNLLWQNDSKIITWNQLDPSWPKRKIKLFGPGPDSGTFDYFTKVINGKSGLSRSNYSHSEDDNIIIHGVSNDVDAIGYFGYAYFINNTEKVKDVAISHKGSDYIKSNGENILKNIYKPLSRPIYIYANKNQIIENIQFKKFIIFYLKSAEELTRQVGYVNLDNNEYKKQVTSIEMFEPKVIR